GKAFVSPNGRWVAVQRYLGDPVYLDLCDVRRHRWRKVKLARYLFVVDAVCFSSTSDLMLFASGTDGGGTRLLERLDLKTMMKFPAIDYPLIPAAQLGLSPAESRLAVLGYKRASLAPHDRRCTNLDGTAEVELEDIGDLASIHLSPNADELAI